MEKYLVYDIDNVIEETDEMALIDAKTEEEAKEKFINNVAIENKVFKSYIYEKAWNVGLAERFFKDHEGYFWDALQVNRRGIKESYIIECFVKNVCEFFGENKSWSEAYIDYILYEKEVEFPKEMLTYIYKNDCERELHVVKFSQIYK